MRTIALGAGTLVLLVGIIIFRSRKQEESGTTARILAEQAYRQAQHENPEIKPTPEIILKESNLYVFAGNNIQACRVQAQESKIHKNSQLTQCHQVVCTMTTNKNWVTTLHAPQAIVNHKNKTILLPKTVSGTINQGKRHTISIQAQESTVDLKNQIVYLKGGVASTILSQ